MTRERKNLVKKQKKPFKYFLNKIFKSVFYIVLALLIFFLIYFLIITSRNLRVNKVYGILYKLYSITYIENY